MAYFNTMTHTSRIATIRKWFKCGAERADEISKWIYVEHIHEMNRLMRDGDWDIIQAAERAQQAKTEA